jgi:hypothetical protein
VTRDEHHHGVVLLGSSLGARHGLVAHELIGMNK